MLTFYISKKGCEMSKSDLKSELATVVKVSKYLFLQACYKAVKSFE
jgi:hypothetical protein